VLWWNFSHDHSHDQITVTCHLTYFKALLINMKLHQGFINAQYTASLVVSFIQDPYHPDLYHLYLDIIWFICVSSCLTSKWFLLTWSPYLRHRTLSIIDCQSLIVNGMGYGYGYGFSYPWTFKQALDHQKRLRIEWVMIDLIVLIITHSILDRFGWSRACFDWKTHWVMGKGMPRCRYRYSQRYLGVTHAIH